MRLEFFWTDTCLLIMLGVLLVQFFFGLRKPPVRASYAALLRNNLAVSAGVILIFYLIIGVLDSIHIPGTGINAHKSPSLLDKILAPMGQSYEKTYSAPLALTLFTTETQIVKGEVLQVYPALQTISKQLKTSEQRNQWVFQQFCRTLLVSCLTGLVLLAVLVMSRVVYNRYAKRKKQFAARDFPANPWHFSTPAIWAFVTFMVFFFLTLLCYKLSRELHVLGTGKIGEDILYYGIKSIRTGLVIGLLTTLIMLPFALFLGMASGYFGGFIDDVIQYGYTTLSSIPGVLLISASVLSLQAFMANHPDYFATLEKAADARLFALCLILGVTSWTSLCRLIRAETLKLKEVDFVMAAHALGSSTWTIFRRHLLPNVMPIVLINLVLDFSVLVLAEAVLAYVGVGVSPLTISWGNMINSARLQLARDPVVWWPVFSAFAFMFILVLSSNLFADAVRDAFDPRRE